MQHPLSHASKPIEPQEGQGGPRDEWPTNVPPPPTPPMPDQGPITFAIARPARLLGIAWGISVPAVLWTHVKFTNPIAAVVVAGGVLLGVGLATVLAWTMFFAFKRSRNAATVMFGGLACLGLCVNVLVGVFMSLASGALREINHGPGTVQAQIKQEISHAKMVAAEEIVKAKSEGVKGLLKDQPAPVSPDLVLNPLGEGETKPTPAPETSAPAHAEAAPPAEHPVPQPPAPRPVKTVATRPVAVPVVKPQVNVPQRGISVRKPGSKMPEPVIATIDEDTVDRVALDAALGVQERLDKAAKRYADSALRLSTARDPLLYHSPMEFKDFHRALEQHRADAQALRDAVVTAAGQMQMRLSQAGVPTPQIERHVSMAFPQSITEASMEFHDAYLAWLDARDRRAVTLEASLGRWRYNPDTKQLWLADDYVRAACEGAFDGVRASSTMLAAKREQAEAMGVPTRASQLRDGMSRVAGEPGGE